MLVLIFLLAGLYAGGDLYENDSDFQGELTLDSHSDKTPSGPRDPFFRALSFYRSHLGLAEYSISELSLKGVLWDNPQKSALFVTPVGKRYFLSIGDTVGSENGTISEINNGKVVITLKNNTIIVKKVLRRKS